MKTILLFMAYYGKLPNYFKLWLACAKNNPSVDFCLITDEDDLELPKNVRLKHMSFEDFKGAIQKKFTFQISLENYGRISQFRPAFAYIFPEEVSGYDFWGFIECDLIFGDIRHFLTDEILESYDKVFKLGHFQLFKNTPKMNTLFMREVQGALSYKYAFSRSVLFFEELLGMHNIARAVGCKTYEENVFADLKSSELPFIRSSYAYSQLDFSHTTCVFSFDRGRLLCHTLHRDKSITTDEVLYVHLQKREMEVETQSAECYMIVPNRFVSAARKVPDDGFVDKEMENLDIADGVDIGYFRKVIQDIRPRTARYRYDMAQKFKKTNRDRLLRAEWWLLRLLRVRIRRCGGVDLNGK